MESSRFSTCNQNHAKGSSLSRILEQNWDERALQQEAKHPSITMKLGEGQHFQAYRSKARPKLVIKILNGHITKKEEVLLHKRLLRLHQLMDKTYIPFMPPFLFLPLPTLAIVMPFGEEVPLLDTLSLNQSAKATLAAFGLVNQDPPQWRVCQEIPFICDISEIYML